MNKTDPLISALEIVGLVLMAMGIFISLTMGAVQPAILFPIGATSYFISFYLNRRNQLRESRRRELAAMYPKRAKGPTGSIGSSRHSPATSSSVSSRRNTSADTTYTPYVDNSYLYTSSDSYTSNSSCDTSGSSNYDSSSSSSSDSGGSCGGSD